MSESVPLKTSTSLGGCKATLKMVIGKGWTLPAYQFCPSILCHQAWVQKWGLSLGSRTALNPTCSPARLGSISRGPSENPSHTYELTCRVGLCAILIPPTHTAHFCWKITQTETKPASRALGGFNTFTVVSCCAVCVTLGFVLTEGHWNARQRCSSCRWTCAEGGFGHFFHHKGYYKVPKSSLCLNFSYTGVHKGKWRCINWSLAVKAIIPTFPPPSPME